MKFSLAVVVMLAVFHSPSYSQKAVILVRHAEKLDESTDPPLSKVGESRSHLLAKFLKDAGITAIYTSEYQRTIKTAGPLADSLKIKPVNIPAVDSEGLFNRIRTQNRNDIVLVVGHNNTVPALLKLFGYSVEITIPSDEYDNLFVLVPKETGQPTVLRMRY